MKKIPLLDLYLIKKRLINEGLENDPMMDSVLESIKQIEDSILEHGSGGGCSATGGPMTGSGTGVYGMPSSSPGLGGGSIGTNWNSGNMGGVIGMQPAGLPASSGSFDTTDEDDIIAPYNAGSGNGMRQKFKSMGKGHGAMTGKKSRVKKLDMKTIQNMMGKKDDHTKDSKKEPKVMNFNDFLKNDITTVKK